MNPILLAQLLGLVQGAIAQAPALIAEFNAIKAAGSATPDQLADLEAKIDAMDAARRVSWKAADDALSA